MISSIVGRPGGGKSYEAVRYHIIPAIQEGRKVITNIPLNIVYIKTVYPDANTDLIEVRQFGFHEYGSLRPFSTPQEYTDETWRDEKTNVGPLFVVDEAHLSLPSQGTPRAIVEYMTMHRHYGVDIILVTQNLRQMNRDIVGLTEITYRCSKNRALGFDNRYTKKVQDGTRGEVLSTEQRTYDSAYFKFYQSHTQTNKAVQEAGASDVKPIWSHWSFKGVLICLVIVIIMGYKSCSGLSEMNKRTIDNASLSRVSDTQSPVENSSVTQSPKTSTYSPPQNTASFRHPYDNVQIVLTGFYQVSKHTVSSVKTEAKYFFSLRKGGLELAEVDNVNLIMAGYDVRILNECLAELRYPDTGYHDWILCDRSNTKLPPAVDGLSTAASSAKNTVKTL